jgi:hypothetical protein
MDVRTWLIVVLGVVKQATLFWIVPKDVGGQMAEATLKCFASLE